MYSPNSCLNYAQYYKNGVIEIVSKLHVFNGQPSISFEDIIMALNQGVSAQAAFLNGLYGDEPFVLSFAFINAADARLAMPHHIHNTSPLALGKNVMIFEDTYVNSFPNPKFSIFRQFLNDLFNACGYSKCSLFDERGSILEK